MATTATLMPTATNTPNAPPSLLAITSQLPWPLNSGGHLRTYHLLRGLSQRFRVRLIAAGQDDAAIETLLEAGIETHAVRASARQRWREALRAGWAGLRGDPYVFYRRHDRSQVRHTIRALCELELPDVIYLDHLDTHAFEPLLPKVPRVIDLHNVYSVLAARAADEHPSLAGKLYLRREARLLARLEAEVARSDTVLTTVSPEDALHFTVPGHRAPWVVPNGVDCEAYRHLPTGRAGSLVLYLGALSWEPNVAAAEFLARNVLPALRERQSGTRVRIVGRQPTPRCLALASLPGVEVLGNVPDVSPHLAEASALAVPLQTGGGTRLKILEAFAAGLPVVSTAVGCEGLSVRHDEHLVVAEREQFGSALAQLLSDPERGTRLATAARQLVETRFDWSVSVAVMQNAVAESLARARS